MALKLVESERMPRLRFRCPQCAEKHAGLPALVFGLPDDICALPQEEQSQRAQISNDLCILDDRRYFIRGILKLPVQDVAEALDYGTWVEIARRDFCRYAVHLTGGAQNSWALFGQIANQLPAFGSPTMGLACRVTPVEEEGGRPLVTIAEGSHPLYGEQRDGLTLARLSEVIAKRPGFFLIVD